MIMSPRLRKLAMLSPAMGAVLMSASTIVVAINAKLLKVNN